MELNDIILVSMNELNRSLQLGGTTFGNFSKECLEHLLSSPEILG
jgi:hypothetical protein